MFGLKLTIDQSTPVSSRQRSQGFLTAVIRLAQHIS